MKVIGKFCKPVSVKHWGELESPLLGDEDFQMGAIC